MPTCTFFFGCHGERWPEEDEASGGWSSGGRKRSFGAERPFDDVLLAKPYLACEYGLFTGSAVRWYLEGHTEFSAVLEILSEPAKFGIELVNLRGVIKADRDNIALKLGDWLAEDRALKRFSMISFDYDVGENLTAVRRQLEDDKIVGYVSAHRPDFEFANFTLGELVEVAARIDESEGFSGQALRTADWTGIVSGRTFEDRYTAISGRMGRRLKGQVWGRALAKFAMEDLRRADDGCERPLVRDIRMAVHARISNYDEQVERFTIDPLTFELTLRSQEPNAKTS